jgi:large subunit ribosomal protein L17
MRHGKKINHLGRKKGHRDAMLTNMANSLLLHKRIQTTVAKAKALKVFVEPLITKAKDDSTHSRRVVFSYLQNKEVVSELFRDISQKIGNRPGGYTRILKTGNRLGDNAEMCFIELVDYNETMLAASETKTETKKSRRRRGGKKSTDSAETKVNKPKAEVAEAKVEEVAPEVENEEAVVDTVQDSVAVKEPKAEVVETEKPKAEVETEEPKEDNTEEDKEKE